MGTTFRIYLPRVKDALEVLAKPASEQRDLRGSETVVVVEDQPALRELFTTMLAKYGYRVISVSTPVEALELAKTLPGTTHLLMTDVVLPGMSGRVLADEFVRARPETKVLFVSAFTEGVLSDKNKLVTGAEFLQKPFSHRDLASKVRELLDRNR